MRETPWSRRWVVWSLVVYALAVAVVVFAPVSYAGIVHRIAGFVRADLHVTFFGSGWIEFFGNVVMFMPLGFLLTLLLRRPWMGLVLAVVLSAGVELAQLVIPDRQGSVRDVVANGIGAGIGALMAWLLVIRPARRRANSALPRPGSVIPSP